MALSKPGGCVLMVLGVIGMLWGITLLAFDMLGWGLGLIASGILMMMAGRRPGAEAALIRTTQANQAHQVARTTKRCPACAEDILAEATKCRFCGAALE